MHLSSDPAARRRLAALAITALAALVLGLIAGMGGGDSGGRSRLTSATGGVTAAGARLTLRQQVGQVLVSSFDGVEVPDYLGRRLRESETAGVILFSRNVLSPPGLRRLTRSLQRAGGGAALVATDQEGGTVRSIPFAGPVPAQPEQGEPRQVEALSRAAARDLRRLGVNVNLAPVADVTSGPGALAGRTFGGTSAEVGQRVGAFVRGARAGRVAAAAKHFPGLGAGGANTDDGPVTIPAPRVQLDERDLPPFRAAIAAHVPLMMASHALYPAYDSARIASQSAVLLRLLLRRRLGFRGVVITDSIEADAVLRRSSVAIAAERSLDAGADLVLMTGSGSWREVYPHVLARARRSPSFRARLREAAGRVLDLKRSLGLPPPPG
jgi:beta-N-acetylhexosaminidase